MDSKVESRKVVVDFRAKLIILKRNHGDRELQMTLHFCRDIYKQTQEVSPILTVPPLWKTFRSVLDPFAGSV